MSLPFIQIGPKTAGEVLLKPIGAGSIIDAPGPIIQGTPILNGSYILNKNGYTFGGSQYRINIPLSITDADYLRQLMIDNSVHMLITEKGVFDGYIETYDREGFVFHVLEKTSESVTPEAPTITDHYRAYVCSPWVGIPSFYGYDDDVDAFQAGYAPYNLIEIPATSISMSSSIRDLEGTSTHILNMFVQIATPDLTVPDLLFAPYTDICVTYTSYLDDDQTEISDLVMYGKVLDGFGSVSIYEGAKNESVVIQGRISVKRSTEFYYFDLSDGIRDRSTTERTSLNTPWPRCPSGPSEASVSEPDKAIKRLISGKYFKFKNGTDYFDMRSVRYDIRAGSVNIGVASE